MSAKRPLSKHNQEPKRVSFNLTSRDIEILTALNRYRYLSTMQVKELFFTSNKDLQGARRRLKMLFHGQFIGRVSTYRRIEEGTPQFAYYLDKKGAQLLKDNGYSVHLWKKAKQVKMQFLQHALDLSQFRIHLEQGLGLQELVEMETFIPDFQMKNPASKLVSKHRYELFDELTHPVNRKSYVIYPDALIILRADVGTQTHKSLYFLEIDRSTHGLERIRDKVTGYNLYLKKELQKRYGAFQDFRVLFQTTTEKRAENIRNALVDHEGKKLVWVTDFSKVDSESVLFSPIWRDVSGTEKRLIAKQSND